MKKIYTIAPLFIITCMLVSITGCGKKEEIVPEVTEYVEDIFVEKDSSIPNIIELSRTEILAMTAAEVQTSVEEYLPNYRATYKIDADREMSEADWLQLRDIICIQLYGSLLDGEPAEAEEVFSDDPDAIYYAPTVEAIEAMDLENFAIYLNNMYTYYYGETWLEDNNLDFTTLDEQTLLDQKQELIKILSGASEATEGGAVDDTETKTVD